MYKLLTKPFRFQVKIVLIVTAFFMWLCCSFNAFAIQNEDVEGNITSTSGLASNLANIVSGGNVEYPTYNLWLVSGTGFQTQPSTGNTSITMRYSDYGNVVYDAEIYSVITIAGLIGGRTYDGSIDLKFNWDVQKQKWDADSSTWQKQGNSISSVGLVSRDITFDNGLAIRTSGQGSSGITVSVYFNDYYLSAGQNSIMIPCTLLANSIDGRIESGSSGSDLLRLFWRITGSSVSSVSLRYVSGEYHTWLRGITDPVVNAINSQTSQVTDGYSNSSGDSSISSGNASVESGVSSEHEALGNASGYVNSVEYDSPNTDLSSLASAFSLISEWFTSFIESLGSFNMLIYVSLTMVVALFAIGYFRSGGGG